MQGKFPSERLGTRCRRYSPFIVKYSTVHCDSSHCEIAPGDPSGDRSASNAQSNPPRDGKTLLIEHGTANLDTKASLATCLVYSLGFFMSGP